MEGVKFDKGKDPYHLIPFDALKATLKVMAFGAGKYGERNWEAGMDWSRLFSAAMRHLSAWWERDTADPETGYSHLWHAACCILFLIAYELRGKGKDDRPEKEKPLPVKEEVRREGIYSRFRNGTDLGQNTIYMSYVEDERKPHAGIVNYAGPLRRTTDSKSAFAAEAALSGLA